MELVAEALRDALALLVEGDGRTYEIIARSLRVSLTATLIAFALGLPLGMLLAFGSFPGRRWLQAAVNTGMGMPPVVIGLLVTVMLWRSGPFGALFRFYSKVVMPAIGGLLTGNRAAYEYLPRTAAAFPAGERFLDLMDKAGAYRESVALPMTFVTSYLYVGTVR